MICHGTPAAARPTTSGGPARQVASTSTSDTIVIANSILLRAWTRPDTPTATSLVRRSIGSRPAWRCSEGTSARGCARRSGGGSVGGRRRPADGDRVRAAGRLSAGRRSLRVNSAARGLRRLRHVASTDRQSRRGDVRDGRGDRDAARYRPRRHQRVALHHAGRDAGRLLRRRLHRRRHVQARVPGRFSRQAGARRLHERHRHQHRPRADRQGVRLHDRIRTNPAAAVRVRVEAGGHALADARRRCDHVRGRAVGEALPAASAGAAPGVRSWPSRWCRRVGPRRAWRRGARRRARGTAVARLDPAACRARRSARLGCGRPRTGELHERHGDRAQLRRPQQVRDRRRPRVHRARRVQHRRWPVAGLCGHRCRLADGDQRRHGRQDASHRPRRGGDDGRGAALLHGSACATFPARRSEPC